MNKDTFSILGIAFLFGLLIGMFLGSWIETIDNRDNLENALILYKEVLLEHIAK